MSAIILKELALPSKNLLAKATKAMAYNIDWSGGEGETIFEMVREDGFDITMEDFENDTRAWNRAFKEWASGRIYEKFCEIENRFNGNTIRVWRMITAPKDWNPQSQHPGVYWSWEKNAADAHWGEFENGQVKWLLSADLNYRQIDWVTTLAANASPDYQDEKEIRLRDNVPVRLISTDRV